MVLDEIASALEKRKAELIEMLQNRDNPLEKQHQLYGAINEIELFLQTLSYYEKNRNEENETIKLVKPPEKKESIISRLFSGFRNNK
ncbi:MAG: hypothetical protein QXE31_02495 [Candidatus Woesearchaeota archaeon]